jgi:glycosyltransferase involved in cell wall biosynthesis
MPHISPLLAPSARPAGGAETQIFLLSQELVRRGHRVALICLPLPEGLPASVGGVSVVVRPDRDSGFRRGVGKLHDAVAIWRTLWGLDTSVIVQRAAGFSTAALALMARMRRIRFVYSSASLVDFDYHRLEPRRRNRALFSIGLRLSDTIVVQSAEQAQLCRARLDREPVLIRSIAEPAEPRGGSPSAFLWIGRLAAYKRPYEYVELARSVPEARFRMVATPQSRGVGIAPDELERVARDVPNLELIPACPRPRLMKLIDDAVAIVNTTDSEGMPNVFLEGWARGVPALSLNHDPDGIIERAGVGCFARGSPERLATIARRLWSHRDNQAALSARCRSYVESEHSLARVAEQWTEALGIN